MAAITNVLEAMKFYGCQLNKHDIWDCDTIINSYISLLVHCQLQDWALWMEKALEQELSSSTWGQEEKNPDPNFNIPEKPK